MATNFDNSFNGSGGGNGFFPSNSGYNPPTPINNAPNDIRIQFKDSELDSEPISLNKKQYDDKYVVYSGEFTTSETQKQFFFIEFDKNNAPIKYYYPDLTKVNKITDGFDYLKVLSKESNNVDSYFLNEDFESGIKIIVNFTLGECGLRFVSGNSIASNKYRNRFNLEFMEQLDNEFTVVDNKNINFIYYNGDFESRPVSENSISGTLNSFYHRGVKLKFFGEHYSKYAPIIEKKPGISKYLKAFISSDDDYEYYNLNTDGTFNKCVAIGITDSGGRDCHAYLGLITLKYENNTYSDGSKDERNMYEYSDNSNMPLSTLWDKQQNLIINTFNFIFPIIWTRLEDRSGDDEKDYKGVWYDSDKKITLSPNLLFYNDKKSSTDPQVYVGTCAYYDSMEDLCIQDQKKANFYKNDWTKWQGITADETSPIFYGKHIATFLENSFYVNKISETMVNQVVNYAYLEPNITQYNRDLIINASIKEDQKGNKYDANKCIAINGIDYYQFIDQIVYNSGLNEEIKQDKNVNLQLEACQKTFPIGIQFQYIKPEFIYDKGFSIQVEAVDNTIKDFIYNNVQNQELEQNVIYCITTSNDNAKSIQELNEGSRFTQEVNSESKGFSLTSGLIKNLIIDNGRLSLDKVITSSNKYNIQFHKNGRKLTEIPKNILFFKDEYKLDPD